MTITLLIIFTTVVARNILADSVTELSKKVDMSIYLKTGTTEEQAKPIIADLRKLHNVERVEFVSSEKARQQSAEDNKADQDIATLSKLISRSKKLSMISANRRLLATGAMLSKISAAGQILRSGLVWQRASSLS